MTARGKERGLMREDIAGPQGASNMPTASVAREAHVIREVAIGVRCAPRWTDPELPPSSQLEGIAATTSDGSGRTV